MHSRVWTGSAILILTAELAPSSAARGAPQDSTCWLVLRDGGALAARCPYEVRGKSLRFHALNGVWAALPLELVDLEASAAARSRPSPRAARNMALAEDETPAAVSSVGRAGEAAKRAGHKGAFIDLSGIVTPPIADAEDSPPPAAAAPALVVVGRPPANRRKPPARPDPLLRMRVKRTGKPR